MISNQATRRTALKLLLTGSVVSLATGCAALSSLPRGTGGSTDGSELALKVSKALRTHPYTSQLSLAVTSEGDEVVIKGVVPSRADVENVDIVANQVEGVRHAVIDVFVRK